jgi:hypothetical protein
VAPVAAEQRASDPLLEPLHLHRHRRLRLEDDLRRAREGAGIGDRNEGLELVGIEHMRHGGPQESFINIRSVTHHKHSFGL